MLTERTDQQIEILVDGQLQIRDRSVIMRDGVDISYTDHRKVIDVEGDVTSESARIQAVSGVLWSQAVINARRSARAPV